MLLSNPIFFVLENKWDPRDKICQLFHQKINKLNQLVNSNATHIFIKQNKQGQGAYSINTLQT